MARDNDSMRHANLRQRLDTNDDFSASSQTIPNVSLSMTYAVKVPFMPAPFDSYP